MAVVNNIGLNIGVQIPVLVPAFNSLGGYQEEGLPDRTVLLCLILRLAIILFSAVAAPFYTLASDV